MSPKSSGFRVRIAASRTFGIIEPISAGKYRLSALGAELIDPQKAPEAKVNAFLNVPLFNATYERWRGSPLPPAAALEREMVGLGVAEKQKERARQVLERSAQQAGFSDQGKGRLVKPGITQHKPPPTPPIEPANGGGNGGGGTLPPELDPIIAGLLARLPKSGAVWPEAQQQVWLDLLKGSFKLIYLDEAHDWPTTE